jgi:ATP-dependent DNA ligase
MKLPARARPRLPLGALGRATFIESMECLPVTQLPEGKEWTYEIKLDGFRLQAVKNAGKTTVYSRRRNVLNEKFSYIASSLKTLPDSTVIDGEIVALDRRAGRISSYCRISARRRPGSTTLVSIF